MVNMEIGTKVKFLRKEKGLRAHELARKANVTIGWLYKLERNELKSPGAIFLYSIATSLGVSIEDLVDESKVHAS